MSTDTTTNSAAPSSRTYHAVLIGIDRYPTLPWKFQLHGCVSDIDLVERLLTDTAQSGQLPAQLHITRLAASHPGASSTSRLQAQTQEPTKANIVAVLQALTGADVQANDRVLIYYSGHGDQKKYPGMLAFHEALVPNDVQLDSGTNFLYDIEINGLINAIARRTQI